MFTGNATFDVVHGAAARGNEEASRGTYGSPASSEQAKRQRPIDEIVALALHASPRGTYPLPAARQRLLWCIVRQRGR